MKQTQIDNERTDTTKKRAEIEQDLHLQKKYWLETIHPFIAKRAITDWNEFTFVRHAYWQLEEAVSRAGRWNAICDQKKNAAYLRIDNLDLRFFPRPQMAKTMFDDINPERLAIIAAHLVKNNKQDVSPYEAVCDAHKLIIATERYIGTLPEKLYGEDHEPHFPSVGMAYTRITFSEIEASNNKHSGLVPLLPPVQQKNKAMAAAEIAEQPLSRAAIKSAVKKFLKTHTPNISKDDDNYCLKNDQISLQDLCTLRHDRFRSISLNQRGRAKTREENKQAKMNSAYPTSAASSQIFVGKSEKRPPKA